MNKNTYFVCFLGLGLLNGCGGGESTTHEVKESAHTQQLFAAVPSNAEYQTQSLTTRTNNTLYTDAGRLVRFEQQGHQLSLVDISGIKNGALRQEGNSFLYIPQTADGETKSTDSFVYSEDGVNKTVTVQINDDPMYAQQWHLHNVAQTAYTDMDIPADGETDINMKNALASSYLGQGVTVGVVDYGADITHPDLNVGKGSLNLGSPVPAASQTSMPVLNGHGTAVAGIIAEKGWNNIGGRGVAPEAKIISFNFLDSPQNALNFARSHGFSNTTASATNNLNSTDDLKKGLDNLARVYNESWGTTALCTNDTDWYCLNEKAFLSIAREGARHGFKDKGIIYLKSSANNEQGFELHSGSAQPGYYQPSDSKLTDFTTFDPQLAPNVINHGLPFIGGMLSFYKNSPYVTVVSSVTAQGKQASYSGSGANVFIAGLGGERPYPRIITTDVQGCNESIGFANFTTRDTFVDSFNQGLYAENQNCDYNAEMDGTSAATPVVAGAVADILSVNPDLSWRDIRNILAHTAKKVDPQSKAVTLPLKDGELTAQLGWVTNAAGLHFNNKYGFGLVDIDKAIAMAKTYSPKTLGSLVEFAKVRSKDMDKTIPDASAKGLKEQITVSDSAVVETVSLYVNIEHERLNDVQVELISPKGTHAIALNPYNGIPKQNSSLPLSYTFNINTFWGEPMQGEWTLRVFDANDGTYSQKMGKTGVDLNPDLIKADNNSKLGVVHDWSIQINGHKGA
ncbi:S8 family serine peptidase [Vibrio rarus]|uniref:S8 family serine peptidase n=1 Tax=Vibrio rarus TaxID=413403 RepID=UPI0021C4519A|nr:S8 family serine peptidase [Vibrio rarus]